MLDSSPLGGAGILFSPEGCASILICFIAGKVHLLLTSNLTVSILKNLSPITNSNDCEFFVVDATIISADAGDCILEPPARLV